MLQTTNYLFAKTTKKIQALDVPHVFSTEISEDKFDSLLEEIKLHVETSFTNDDEDIEDLGDIITLLNISTYKGIKNKYLTDKHVNRLVRLRVLAKKKVKHKFRNFKYNGRQFWNYQEANFQYHNLVTYVWQPSLTKLRNLIMEHRPNYHKLLI